MFQYRWFQEDAVEATYDIIKDFVSGDEICEKHPVIVAPTGCGKTAIICKLIDRILSENPFFNILVLCDDKKILRQNHKAIEGFFEIEAGLCSAGLDSYYIKKITVAGIQSIYRKWKDFEGFDIVIIDEAHTINTKEKGMYRKFLKKIGMLYIGLTATAFRTGYGYIYEGDDALFNCVSYDMSSPEIFNRIVDEGFLKPLYAYPTALKLSGEGCRTTAGDYNEKDLSEKNDRVEITRAAIIETIHYGKNYNHWLFFAIDIKHCENIKNMLIENGIEAVAVHSQNENVDSDILKFTSGKVRAAVHVNMLTKGFDFPAIDLICDMRPTKSPIIHVQGKGRGTRPVYADGDYNLGTVEGRLKAIEDGEAPHCLVLDFAGNVARLGPINYVKVKKKGEKEGSGEAVTKECPECNFINWGGAKVCENCGEEFIFKEKLEMKAGKEELIKRDLPKEKPEPRKVEGWAKVTDIRYSKHFPRSGKAPSFRVDYQCGMQIFSEFISIDGYGYAKHIAKSWIDYRWDNDQVSPPRNLKDLMATSHMLKMPREIKVNTTGRYPKIVDSKF